MNSCKRLLWLVLICACASFSGCTETRFASTPGDNIETCDLRWKGLWGPSKEEEPDNRTAIFVDDECRFIVLDQPEKGGPFKRIHIPVNFVHADGNDYLVIADTAIRDLVKLKPVFGVDPMPEKAFFFSRYAASKDHIELYPVDSAQVAKQIVDGKLDGTVSKTANELHVFVSGDRAHTLETLRHGSIFADKADIRMTRLNQSADEFERSLINKEHKKSQ